MDSEAGVLDTLKHITLAIGICGVVVPCVTGLSALLGFSRSFFAVLGFGAVSLALSCGLVLLAEGRLGQGNREADPFAEST